MYLWFIVKYVPNLLETILGGLRNIESLIRMPHYMGLKRKRISAIYSDIIDPDFS